MFEVAPYLGAWIEIMLTPSLIASSPVAPYLGAWIEISQVILRMANKVCRSLLGGVD